MLSWNDYYVQEQMREDRMAEAEHERLVKLVSSQKESSFKKFSTHLLESLGSRLVSWGDSLLNRCANMSLVSRGQSSQSNL